MKMEIRTMKFWNAPEMNGMVISDGYHHLTVWDNGKVAACEGDTDVEPIGEVWDELKSYKERISEFKQVESLSTGGIDYKLYTLDE